MSDNSLLRSERLWRLFREGLWIILGQSTGVVGALVGVRLLTELMAPAAYGELALGMTMATLVDQLIFGPLANGIARFYAPSHEVGDLRRYLTSVRRMLLSATAGIILAGLLLALCLMITRHAEWIGLVTAAIFFGLLSGHNTSFNGLQNAARQRFIVALHHGMEPWARFVASAGMMVLLGTSSAIAMVGCGFGVLLVLCSQYLFFRKIIPKNEGTDGDIRTNWAGQIQKYSWPFSAWGIFTWAQMASDRWALGTFTTMQEVGLYAVLFHLGHSPLSRVTGMAMQFLAPIFYQRAGDATSNFRNASVTNLSRQLTRWALGATFASFLLAYLFHRQIFRIIVAEEYVAVSYLLPWMVLAGGLSGAGQTIALNLMSQMRTKTIAIVKIATALLGIGFNFAGAYYYGAEGIVIAGVLFAAVYFLWMLALSGPTEEPRTRLFGGSA